VKDARLILLDEPLGNLDYKLREDLRLELRTLFRDRDAIFVYATPEPIDALTMATHVAVLHEGKVIQYGPVEEVYYRPDHVKSGEYFSDPPMNFLPCEVEGGIAVVSEDLSIPLETLEVELEDGPYVLGLRPHRVYVSTDRIEHPESAVSLDAKLELAEVVGSDMTMHLRHGDMVLTALVREIQHYDLHQRVELLLDVEHIHVFAADDDRLLHLALAERRKEEQADG
jgi:glycerol transport system ATP-binding protein